MTKLCEHKILSPFTSFDSNRLSELSHSKQLKPLKKLTIPGFRLKRKISRCCSFSLSLDGQTSDINAATYQVKPATDDSSAGRSKGGDEEGRAASVTTSIFFPLLLLVRIKDLKTEPGNSQISTRTVFRRVFLLVFQL
jgi:hypothetical protein